MTRNRPNEPIEPASIPPDDTPKSEDELLESEAERQARESEKAFDQAITRIPPG